MRFNRFLLSWGIALVCALTITGYFIGTAQAASEVVYPVNLGAGLEAVIALVFGIISAAAGALMTLLFGRDKSKIKLEKETRTYLELAIKGALITAEGRLRTYVRDMDDPTVRSQLVATALNLLLASIPQVISKTGLSQDSLKDLIESSLLEKAVTDGPVVNS